MATGDVFKPGDLVTVRVSSGRRLCARVVKRRRCYITSGLSFYAVEFENGFKTDLSDREIDHVDAVTRLGNVVSADER